MMQKFKETNKYCDEQYYECTSVMDYLYKDKENKLIIYFGVPLKNKFKKISDPYFKVYRYIENKDNIILTDLCRISMKKPKYIIGMNESMILTKKELISFINILNNINEYIPKNNIWISAVNDLNKNMYKSHYIWFRKININYIPNYYLLETED